MQIVLASSSPYRKRLLARLNIEFETIAPEVDETPLENEAPETLALRLATEKALAVAKQYPDALIIASDQVAVLDGQVLGKPGTVVRARQQLTMASGKQLDFLTAVHLYNTASGSGQSRVVPYSVVFRDLPEDMVNRYIEQDQPLDCAGSFKWESLGIALFSRMSGDDVTALEGLPLICLVDMLANEGVRIP